MRLVDFPRGARVRLSDSRLVELAWPFWWHGTLKKEQEKTPPVAWFVREIRDAFGGGEERSEPFALESDLAVVEVVREAAICDEHDHAGEGGGDSDPLLTPARKGRNSNQGALL